MNLDQIKVLCEKGEKKRVEYKISTANLRAAFETLCGFLNGQGGTVLIGVNDQGKIIGQHISDNTRQAIATEMNRIEPPASIEVEYIEVEKGKVVIILHVEAGFHAPYVYDGRPFQRDESRTSRMTQHRYEQLLVKRGQLNYAWEDQPALGYTIDALDSEEIRKTIREGIDKNRIATEVAHYTLEEMLRYLKLMQGEKITHAAVVLYAKDVEPNYSQCLLRLTRYNGNTKLAPFTDSKHVYGNAFILLSEMNYFTMRHLPVASFFEAGSLERIDRPAVPVMAMREALINAISHRNYANPSSSISVSLFNNRLEIWSQGTLPPEIKIEDLKKNHESYPRNRRIAKIFYSRGWVEKAGIGTLRMIEDCRKLGIPAPHFEEYSNGFSVTFRFGGSIGVEFKENMHLKTLSPRQEKVLALLKQYKSLTPKQVVSHLENSPSERTIRNDLNVLKQQGLITMQGSARNTIWLLKE